MTSEVLVPTFNFSMVCPGVYRGGYPTKKNYPFLRALRLKSILYLCPEEYAESNLKFCEQNNIHLFRFPTEGNKEPFVDIPESLMHRMLSVLVDTRNFPIFIHCNKGKHRTGTVVGCLRALQGVSLLSRMEEYKRFAQEKARPVDMLYMELYRPIVKLHQPFVAPWVVPGQGWFVEREEELEREETRQLLNESLLSPSPYHTKDSEETPLVFATNVQRSVATTTTSVTVVPYDKGGLTTVQEEGEEPHHQHGLSTPVAGIIPPTVSPVLNTSNGGSPTTLSKQQSNSPVKVPSLQTAHGNSNNTNNNNSPKVKTSINNNNTNNNNNVDEGSAI